MNNQSNQWRKYTFGNNLKTGREERLQKERLKDLVSFLNQSDLAYLSECISKAESKEDVSQGPLTIDGCF